MSDKSVKLGNEFLNIARSIANCYESNAHECIIMRNEGLIRSGVSRAYYAAFIIARLAVRLEYFRRKEVHEKVIDRLKEDGHADIADKLFKLRMKRNDADYDVYINITAKTLKWAIKIANDVIRELFSRYEHQLSL